MNVFKLHFFLTFWTFCEFTKILWFRELFLNPQTFLNSWTFFNNWTFFNGSTSGSGKLQIVFLFFCLCFHNQFSRLSWLVFRLYFLFLCCFLLLFFSFSFPIHQFFIKNIQIFSILEDLLSYKKSYRLSGYFSNLVTYSDFLFFLNLWIFLYSWVYFWVTRDCILNSWAILEFTNSVWMRK